MSPISDFFKNRTVFITGATGFMGKVLLEKLVWSLPEIKKIYILLRPKKGCSPHERVKSLTESLIFSFKNYDRNALNKIEAITGDITEDGLGISEVDQQKLIDEVSIIFHGAASIRMNLSLKEAVITNTKSTYQLFKFCLHMKELVSLVHISTAYCNIEIENMAEKVYATKYDPYKVIDLVEWMDDDCLAKIENDILDHHPNTYTFSKRLSEVIAMDMGNKLPLVIARPSIVVPSFRDPIPGWTDNYFGPIGMTVAKGAGILRISLLDANVIPRIIPVDMAINNLIIIAHERAKERYTQTPVYNVTFGPEYKRTYGETNNILLNAFYEYPLSKMFWYPRDTFTTNYPYFMIYTILFHFVPAFVVDFLLVMFLQKPFLLSLHYTIFQAWRVLYHFTVKQWHFSIEENKKIIEKLCLEDAKAFYTYWDVDFNHNEYSVKSYLFLRKYMLKEDLSNVKYTRILLKVLYVLDISCKTMIIYWFCTYILSLL